MPETIVGIGGTVEMQDPALVADHENLMGCRPP
jgi:hypothetical protein